MWKANGKPIAYKGKITEVLSVLMRDRPPMNDSNESLTLSYPPYSPFTPNRQLCLYACLSVS